MGKIKYSCKNCGWETHIRQEWADLKPKRCMNKKCNTSFLANPAAMVVEKPEEKPIEVKVEKQKSKKQQ